MQMDNQNLLEHIKDLQDKDKLNKQMIQKLLESMDSKDIGK
jgi:hypothetical protein